MLPFTTDQFFQVFQEYNLAVWPAQVVAYAMAALVLVVFILHNGAAYRLTLSILGILWIWNGIAYHLVFFARINGAAYAFAALFIIQGLLFLGAAARRSVPVRSGQSNLAGWTGAFLIAYALVIYNVVGALADHTWPRAPIFGVAPCPTVIFTLGILMLLPQRIPGWLLIVPLAWAAIGSTAAVLLSVTEDLGLLAAGLAAAGWLVLRNKTIRTEASVRAER